MNLSELEIFTLNLSRKFEDHQHTGLDSLPVVLSLTNQGSLTAQDTASVDGTYGAEEAGVIDNNRTRILQIENVLKAAGLLA